jgi:hypothetical protein
MKFRRAALALVGWYLLTPPLHPCDGDPPCTYFETRPSSVHLDFNLKAPLRRWRKVGTFATQKECEAGRRASPSEQCIVSDDPRLKEK